MIESQTRRSPGATGLRDRKENATHAHHSASRPAIQTSPVDELLGRLEGVQSAGAGYRARCPACGGQGRKLSIASGDDSRVLLTCFSCHDTPAILAALGLTIGDLFPARITHTTTPQERRELRQRAKESQWSAALNVLAREADVILVAASYPSRGEQLTVDDRARLTLAIGRVQCAREVLRG